MTNLQDGSSRMSGAMTRRLWLLVPAGVLGLLGVLVIVGALVPLWSGLQRESQRLQELEALRDQVTMMRSQLTANRDNEQAAEASKDKIVRLITGNGDTSTFLAMVDREAKAVGVQLDLYEPQQAAPEGAQPPTGAAPQPPPAPPPPPGQPGAAAAPAPAAGDPLAIEGLERTSLFVTAKGTFPALRNFLQRLEALNLLVVQSDLNLSLNEETSEAGQSASANGPVILKLAFGFYSESSGNPKPAPPAAPPAPAGAPPAPAAPN